MDSPLPSNTNISASELDEETKTKLKGDTIGDTLYSESFVLKTLMNLSNIQFNEELEQDLCFLWDMTVEKEVCQYLFDVKFPEVVCGVLPGCEEGRVIEILVGILANILLAPCDKTISDSNVETVLKEFETSDSAVLVQLMRFLEAVAYGAPKMVNFLDQDRIIFILNYSEHEELISQTLQTLVRLTEGFKLSEVKVSSPLVEATVEGFKTLYPNDFELDTDETKKNVRSFLILMANYCAYAQNFHNLDDVCVSVSNSEALRNVVSEVLRYFSEEGTLFPVSDEFCDCISSVSTIITTRDVRLVTNNFFKTNLPSLSRILLYLHQERQECAESFNMVLELVGSLIYIMDQEVVLKELRNVGYKRGIVVLNCLKESSRTFEFDINEKLRFLFVNFK